MIVFNMSFTETTAYVQHYYYCHPGLTFTSSTQVLPHAIDVLQKAGYKLVTLAECLGEQPYQHVGSPSPRDVSSLTIRPPKTLSIISFYQVIVDMLTAQHMFLFCFDFLFTYHRSFLHHALSNSRVSITLHIHKGFGLCYC